MYFPYLRGRQYEIIAIRELLELGLITDKIIPIIEPVKLSSTLIKAMQAFIDTDRDLVIIHNPMVGSFLKDSNEAKKADLVKKYNDIVFDKGVTKGHIVNKNSAKQLQQLDDNISIDKIVSISFKRDDLNVFKSVFANKNCKYNLIPDDRKFGRIIRNNKVLFSDRYNKRPRNVDYSDIDEFFSDDHLFFEEEGYVGYSDFSIVGDEYSESGFAPYAVTIHFVYFNEDNELYAIHFVSDSNEDIRDPGGKFYEAITHLYNWSKGKNINTYGYNELIKHYENQTYPGLGVVKKLCIMHHLELISQYLGEERQ